MASAIGDKSWSVTFRLTPRDARAIHRTNLRRYRRAPIYVATLFAAMGAGLGRLVGGGSGASPGIATAIGCGMGVVGFVALLRTAEDRAVRMSQVAGLLDEQTLTIGAEGFERVLSDGRRGAVGWQEVVKVGKTPEYFVIVLDRDAAAVVVPVASFRSEAYASLFMSMAAAWHKQATAGKDEVHECADS